MKYLIPSMGQYLISMICKYPEQMKACSAQLGEIIKYLMSTEVRMELTALEIAGVLFERLGLVNESLLKEVLFQIFTCMHFYKNNTKNKAIPLAIIKQIFVFFSTIIVTFNVEALLGVCNQI